MASLGLAAPVHAEEEIIVTARKREESIQSVPVAVSAFTTEAIEDRQIRDISDVARFAPGLNFAKAFGRTTERPVIRGQGNVLAGVQFGVESGAAYFVDGIYYPGDLQSLNIRNVERVEVIRGPQSALFGRNTYSGAINFVTRSPGEELYTDAAMRMGEDGEFEVSGGISGPLVEGVLGGGLNARYYSFDGEYTNLVTGEKVGDEDTNVVSGTLSWTPTGDLTIRTLVSLQKDDDGTRPFFLQPSEMNNCYPGSRSNASWTQTGSTNNNQYYCGEINRPGDYVTLNDGPTVNTILVDGIPDIGWGAANNQDAYNDGTALAFSGVKRDLTYANLLADWDVAGSGWTVTSALAWRDEERFTGSDSDHSSVNYIRNPGEECRGCGSDVTEADDYSAEVRLESPADDRLRWLIGGFLYSQDLDTRDITFAAPGGGPVIIEEGTDNWAAFGSIAFDFTDTITATLEARYFDEEKSRFEVDGADADTLPDFDRDVDFSEVAPRLTVDWQVNPDLLFYGIYAKGYKPGGLNGIQGLQVGAPTYDQEESDSFELGAKTTWLDGRLLANVAAFFIDAKDIQLTTALSNASLFGALTSIVTNQGSGESLGVEVELQYALTESVNVGASYALADTEFTDGCDEFQWILTSGGGNAASGDPCTGNNVNGLGDGSIEGNQFPLSAKNMASAFMDLRQPIGGGMDLIASADISWEDKKPVQVHNLAWVPAATLVNARIGIDTGRVTVAVYGRNLTDEDAPTMVTRWLQYPLASTGAGGVGGTVVPVIVPSAEPDATNSCTAPNTCSTNFPRAFFGDMRRGRNFGVEFAYRFGGDR
jgi:outer membrane receptor protein involved in Fe transport